MPPTKEEPLAPMGNFSSSASYVNLTPQSSTTPLATSAAPASSPVAIPKLRSWIFGITDEFPLPKREASGAATFVAAPARSERLLSSSSQQFRFPLIQEEPRRTIRRSKTTISNNSLRPRKSETIIVWDWAASVNSTNSTSMSGRPAGSLRTSGSVPQVVPKSPAPQTQSGLTQAAFSSGREKGASATPVPTKSQPLPPPTPVRHFQDQHQLDSADAMQRSMSQGSSYGGFPPKDNRPPVAYTHTRGSNSSSTHVSNLSFGSTGPSSSTQIAFHNLSITDDVTLPMLNKHVYDSIAVTQRTVQNNPGISLPLQSHILEQCRSFSHEYTDKSRALQRKIDNSENSVVNLKNEMEEMMRRLTSERDQAIQEKTITLAQLEQANKQIEQGYSHEQTLRNTNEVLTRQLANLDSSQRGTRSNVTDPFISPTVTTHKKSASGASNIADKTPRGKSPSPSKLSGPAPYIGLPSGPAGSRNRRKNGQSSSLITSTKTITATPTERGDIPTGPNYPESQAMALVHLHVTPESEDFGGEFSIFYGITEGYVGTYCFMPNPEVDNEIPPKKQNLWHYMMSLAYPGHMQDSHTHVMLLISQEESRKFFVMRLILSYCFEKILVIDNWYGFSKETDDEIRAVKSAQQERGLANAERQALINRLVKVVNTILNSQDFEFWKKATMANHCKNLRDYVGMLLNEGAIRQDAGRDLGVLAMRAWDIGVKMHTSGLSFQVIFPKTAEKFSASSMIAKDRLETPPMQLQLTQTRLKLVITPVVTLRDDRHKSIKVRNLHHSTVLTMS